MTADKEEMLQVLTEAGGATGKFEKRSIVHEKRLFHNEVALWILDKKERRVLVQRRSPNKKQNPNKIGLCAGHVVGKESIEEALYKEAREEIGLNLSDYDVMPLTVIKRTEPNNYCFSHHFYIFENKPAEEYKIQKEELSEVFYLPFDKFWDMVRNNDDEVAIKRTDYYDKIFEMLNKILSENA